MLIVISSLESWMFRSIYIIRDMVNYEDNRPPSTQKAMNLATLADQWCLGNGSLTASANVPNLYHQSPASLISPNCKILAPGPPGVGPGVAPGVSVLSDSSPSGVGLSSALPSPGVLPSGLSSPLQLPAEPLLSSFAFSSSPGLRWSACWPGVYFCNFPS